MIGAGLEKRKEKSRYSETEVTNLLQLRGQIHREEADTVQGGGLVRGEAGPS